MAITPGVRGRSSIVIEEAIARGRVVWVVWVRQGAGPVVVLGEIVRVVA